MRRSCWIVVALALASPPAVAAPNASARRQAKRHFDKAETEYKLGRFEEALVLYQEAYELLPEPAFLFNIGQCHRNLGDLDRALYFFRGFLKEAKDPRARARVERLIQEIEAKQEERRREEEERSRRSAATATLSRALPEVATATAVSNVIPPAPPQDDGSGLPVWPFIVAAVVAAVGGGVAIAVIATRGDRVPEDGFMLDWRNRR